MYENTKATFLRWSQNRTYHNVFKGTGLHINPGDDILKAKNFPLVEEIEKFDFDDFSLDTDKLKDLEGKTFDFILFTSLVSFQEDPVEVVSKILEYVKPKGHLILTVPDEDLYEQGNFPSIFNKGHKRSYSIYKQDSWSGGHYDLIEMIDNVDTACCRKIELIDTNYNYSLIGSGIDQTVQFVDGVEACIEVILKKY